MRLWKLQSEMGLSFDMASMSLWSLRKRIPQCILRYRSDVDVDDPEQLKKAEDELWEQLHLIEESIWEWEKKNCKRFKGVRPFLETYTEYVPGEYVEREFKYYYDD